MNRVTFEKYFQKAVVSSCIFKSIVVVHFNDLGQAVLSSSILPQCPGYMYCSVKSYGLGQFVGTLKYYAKFMNQGKKFIQTWQAKELGLVLLSVVLAGQDT